MNPMTTSSCSIRGCGQFILCILTLLISSCLLVLYLKYSDYISTMRFGETLKSGLFGTVLIGYGLSLIGLIPVNSESGSMVRRVLRNLLFRIMFTRSSTPDSSATMPTCIEPVSIAHSILRTVTPALDTMNETERTLPRHNACNSFDDSKLSTTYIPKISSRKTKSF